METEGLGAAICVMILCISVPLLFLVWIRQVKGGLRRREREKFERMYHMKAEMDRKYGHEDRES